MSLLGIIKKRIEQRYFLLNFVMLVFLSSWVWTERARAREAGNTPSEVEEEFQERDLGGDLFKTNKWDHNFALVFGMARGTWVIDEMGPIEGKEFDTRAFFTKFQYSFHLPLYGDLGYVIGSSVGFYWDRSLDESGFKQSTSIHLPGIHFGLVYNFSPFFRIQGGVETYLERVDNLTIVSKNQATGEDEERRVSITMRPNFDWIASADAFYSGNWGLRLEWHLRRVISTPPSSSDGQVIGARLTKKDTWIGLGLIFHLFAS